VFLVRLVLFFVNSYLNFNPSFVATSTAVERVFSRGRHLLVFTRNRLSTTSIRKLLCFGSCCQKDLVQDDDIIKGVEEVMGSKKRKAEDQNSGAVKKVRES
jgi:hypothetical protein